MKTATSGRHHGPHPGILAIIFTVLFNTGLSFVISLKGTPPYFPGPWETQQVITAYFQGQSQDVLLCSFFQFASSIPLGLMAAAFFSRLQFLTGGRATGPAIALFGGLMTVFNLAFSALILWVMAYPGIAQNTAILRTLYYISFAIGGIGYSVPMGLLIAGVAVTSGFIRTLPKWMVVSGIVIALIGEVSTLNLVFPRLLPLIPLTRFPAFIWLIIAGFKLRKTKLKREDKVEAKA